MKTTIQLLAVSGLLLLAGCGGEETEQLSRYPSVVIPMYAPNEYIEQLSDKNPETVYNAICNLGSFADELGDVLWGNHENKEPDPEELNTAQHAYAEICAQLDSKHPLNVAASLRFLQLFVCGHEERSELIGPVCRIQSDHALVQFEQVELLKRLSDDTTRLPEPLLRRLLNSKSWIVSRSTYELIGSLVDGPLRKELVERYRATYDETERLILLCAWSENLEPEEIALLQEEILTSDHERIRNLATCIISDYLDEPGVFAWVVAYYAQLCDAIDEEPGEIFEIVYDVNEEKASGAVRYLFEKGYVPGDEFLDALNKKFESKPDNVASNLLAIEEALIEVPEIAARWQELRDEAAKAKQQLQRRCDALTETLTPLRAEYIMKVQSALTEQGIPDEVQQKYLKKLSSPDVKGMVGESAP
jgi:hypothetical protein